MTTDALPIPSNAPSNTMIVLGCALTASLVLHFLAGASVLGYANAMPPRLTPDLAAVPDALDARTPEEIELGIEESTVASINWLGVVDNPQEGEAEESVVDQAALTVNPGVQAQAQPQQPAPAQEEPAEQAIEQPIQEPIVAEQPTETPTPPVETKPIEIPQFFPLPKPEVVVPEPIEDEPTTQEPVEPGPPVEAEPADPVPEVQPKPIPKPTPEQTAEKSEPRPPSAPSGEVGFVSEKESVATATSISYGQLHRPLVSKGLEIIPKKPKYPWSVRNAASPKNAIVVIYFKRDGSVKYAEFLVSDDGKKRYDTGMEEIDLPLLAAIYQWRAKGKPLLELDSNDPQATLRKTMNIVFSRPRHIKTDG